MESKVKAINAFLKKNKGVKIVLDGPTGSGKGTIASLLNRKLDLVYVSVGNIFRSLACSLKEKGIFLDDIEEISGFIRSSHLNYTSVDGVDKLLFNGVDYWSAIGDMEIADAASIIASNSVLHQEVSALVRKLGRKNILVEGRAAGSYIFPSADIKFYLDASLEQRIERKFSGIKPGNMTREALRQKIEQRDRRDKNKAHAPLVFNDEYIYVDSSDLDVEKTLVLIIEDIYRILCMEK